MTKDSPLKKKEPQAGSSAGKPRRVPLWQAVILPVAAVLIFFFLLEGGLALFGVKPALQDEDPFVGFADNVPLFVPVAGPGGQEWLTTSRPKFSFFNQQAFPREKAPNAYRVFTLGGSTTYGRPYDDMTSFSGWLRELLPAADGSKVWEVINAGGISYASYRVAHLMEELVNYQPDLFIIYTGHNEFLEERTYSQIKEMSPVLRSTVSLMTKTRTWSAMSTAIEGLGIKPKAEADNRDKLSVEVDAILDQSVGLDRYTRDDPLREKILQHYRISLERIVALARSVGAQVIFVTPASSLNDCTPFKSEHTPGLDSAAREKTERMLVRAKEAIHLEDWKGALDLLDAAVALDPRHSEMQYRRGQALLALGRFEEAESALRLARDEDVCPLRALTPMHSIVTEIAEAQDVPVVDYVDLLRRRMQETKGYPIPGEELFLDHVHPTIEGHKILAVDLVRAMINQKLVQPGAGWGEEAIAEVAARIKSRIDRETHGQALANLARVLLWAQKTEEAARLANKALSTAGEYDQVVVDSTSILTSVYVRHKQPERAVEMLYSAIEKAPEAMELRYKLAQVLGNSPFWQWEQAAANLLLVCRYLPTKAMPHELFGMSMAQRGRPEIAYPSFLEALRLNPNKDELRPILARMESMDKNQVLNPQLPQVRLEYYPSRAPRKVVQMRPDPNGRPVVDGIEAEFYPNGRLKHFLDVQQGVPHGLELTWDPDGNELSRVVYRFGTVVVDEG